MYVLVIYGRNSHYVFDELIYTKKCYFLHGYEEWVKYYMFDGTLLIFCSFLSLTSIWNCWVFKIGECLWFNKSMALKMNGIIRPRAMWFSQGKHDFPYLYYIPMYQCVPVMDVVVGMV